jgi:hypothetical protein
MRAMVRHQREHIGQLRAALGAPIEQRPA